MSYIIKNCPCIVMDECNSFRDDEVFCKDCTNCIMKQIVEKCKNTKQSAVTTALRVFANELLQFLDIQEVE